MPLLRLPLCALLCCCVATICAAVDGERLALVRTLPESNPYGPALVRYMSLPEEDQRALRAWASPPAGEAPGPLSSEQQALAHTFTAALVEAAKTPIMTENIWRTRPSPKEPDNPAAILLPEIGPIREIARIATKIADASSAADSIAIYLATAELGRSQRTGETILNHLAGAAIEGIATEAVARRLLDYSPAEMNRLAIEWPATNNIPPLSRALEAEKNVFFAPLIERIFRPGVKAYFAAEELAGREGTVHSDTSALDAHIAGLRLSGLIDDGVEKFISLERIKSGESFTVRQGRTEQGVELVDFDPANRRAHVRIDGLDAVIDLQTKKITATPATTALRVFRSFIASFSFYESPDAELSPEVLAWLEQISRHPEGPNAYFTDLIARYDQLMQAQIESAQEAKTPTPFPAAETDDHLLNLFMPTISGVARSLNANDTQTRMLYAAINHRLKQLDQSVDPFAAFDPWAGADMTPFGIEPATDGGFVLRSAYERSSGKPVTYKFGAADAGAVRN